MCEIVITIRCCKEGKCMSKGQAEYTVHVAEAAAAVVLSPGDPVNKTALPDETVGVAAADFDIVASGGTGPYSFVVTGNLPPGMSALSDNISTLRVTGTPTAAGDYDFIVEATDSLGAAAKTAFSKRIG
jgi:large repetitive protein